MEYEFKIKNIPEKIGTRITCINKFIYDNEEIEAVCEFSPINENYKNIKDIPEATKNEMIRTIKERKNRNYGK